MTYLTLAAGDAAVGPAGCVVGPPAGEPSPPALDLAPGGTRAPTRKPPNSSRRTCPSLSRPGTPTCAALVRRSPSSGGSARLRLGGGPPALQSVGWPPRLSSRAGAKATRGISGTARAPLCSLFPVTRGEGWG